jgi:hypothetical protein
MTGAAGSPYEHIRYLADQNFRESIIEGLRHRRPAMDIVLVKDVGLLHRPDPEILAYAKQHGRALLTQDKRTMPGHLDDFLRSLPAGEHSPGVFLIPQRMATGPAIEEILLIWEASRPEEWVDRITFLPL